MNLIQLIACIGLITGCFVLLHISPMDFTEGVFRRITSKPKSIRSEVNESTRRKKKSFLRREIEETQTILRMTGRAAKFPMVCALSLLLFLVGAAFVSRATWFTDCASTWFTHFLLGHLPNDRYASWYRPAFPGQYARFGIAGKAG